MFKYLVSAILLMLSASASAATCTVTHDELVHMGGKLIEKARAELEGGKHQCRVVLNGRVDTFDRWVERPAPTGRRWPADSVVITTSTGRQHENNELEPHVRVRHASQVKCAPGQEQCALPEIKQMPDRWGFRYRAFSDDSSLVLVLARIAEEDGLTVEWAPGAREALAATVLDWKALNLIGRLGHASSSREALDGVSKWYASQPGIKGALTSCAKPEVVVVSVGSAGCPPG